MNNLRVLREEHKLSQQKLAVEFDLAQSQIHFYETDTYEPDLGTLEKYADYFDVSVDFLLGRTEVRQMAAPVKEYELNEAEQALVNRYRALRPNQRQSLSMFMDTLDTQ